MFVDYYFLLEVAETASLQEIKAAFRKQAIKWHPDRNLDKDTTKQMQLINEAYLILKDEEARNRFDIEYQKFKNFKEKQESKTKEKKPANRKAKGRAFEYSEYEVQDTVLKQWMSNAKRQAIDLAKQTIKDFAGVLTVGAKEGAKAAGKMLVFQIAIGLLFLFIFGLSKSCHS